MDNAFLIRGDQVNPYHLSIAGVIIDGDKIALIKKQSGIHTLPRETVYSNESLVEGLKRGALEELGVEIEVEKFLGSTITYFSRPDGAEIEKTTLYFNCKKINEQERTPREDELNDEVIWVSPEEANNLLDQTEKKIVYRMLSDSRFVK